VDARIKRVALNEKGRLRVPAHKIRSVYIWKDGVTPGRSGSAVLNGHTSAKREGDFDHLRHLEKGDTAETFAGGKTCDWSVRSNNERKPAWFTDERLAELNSFIGPPRLVFITCSKFLGYSPDGHAVYRMRTVTKLKLVSCS
jgi:sortase (surface protein transpeptidase)